MYTPFPPCPQCATVCVDPGDVEAVDSFEEALDTSGGNHWVTYTPGELESLMVTSTTPTVAELTEGALTGVVAPVVSGCAHRVNVELGSRLVRSATRCGTDLALAASWYRGAPERHVGELFAADPGVLAVAMVVSGVGSYDGVPALMLGSKSPAATICAYLDELSATAPPGVCWGEVYTVAQHHNHNSDVAASTAALFARTAALTTAAHAAGIPVATLVEVTDLCVDAEGLAALAACVCA